MRNYSNTQSSARNWYEQIPVQINGAYGDPFLKQQIGDTIQKLSALKEHKAPVAVITKSGYEQNSFEQLIDSEKPNLLTFFYSLTGLNEGNIPLEKREKMIAELTKHFGKINLMLRPIIKGRNDNYHTLASILDIAKEYDMNVTFGGFLTNERKKVLNKFTTKLITNLCKKRGLKYFYKTSCAAAHLKGIECWSHSSGKPVNIDIASQLYNNLYETKGGLVLPTATTGDLNFLRMLTKSQGVYCNELINNGNRLSINSGDQILESNSSWFDWSRNLSSCYGCDYCFIKNVDYLGNKNIESGCNPKDLVKYMHKPKLSSIKPIIKKESHMIGYDDIRTVQPCLAKQER